jgi:recombination protein RecT
VKLERTLQKRKDKMSKEMAAGINVDAQIGAVIALARGSHYLQGCTLDSFVAAVYEANRQGLNLHPSLKHAYLVPFKNKQGQFEATLVVDFRGLIWKAVSAGMIKDADVEIVYENDDFRRGKRFIGGRNESFLEWQPFDGPESERGKVIGAFASFILPDESVKWRYMPIERVEVIRKRAPSAKGKSSPWNTDYEEMVAKTVLKWGFKLIPQTIEFAEVVALDDKVHGPVEAVVTAQAEVIDAEVVDVPPPPDDEPPAQIDAETGEVSDPEPGDGEPPPPTEPEKAPEPEQKPSPPPKATAPPSRAEELRKRAAEI